MPLDIMVPSGLAPIGGRRSVRIPPHDKMVARKVVGLEATVLDQDLTLVAALDSHDPRALTVRVAGPAALLVAKLHKLSDRIAEGKPDRIADKDAGDVYRLMLAVPMPEVVARMRPLLDGEISADTYRQAVDVLRRLFGAPRAEGVLMAVESLRVGVPPERVADVCNAFVRALAAAL